MTIKQLKLFEGKGEFNPDKFEEDISPEFRMNIYQCINEAMHDLEKIDLVGLDKTTRANILNNKVLHKISERFKNDKKVKFHGLNNSRRKFITYGDYLFIFKKIPVSNTRTKLTDEINSQSLGKHIITVAYDINELWTDVSSASFQYRINYIATYISDLNNSSILIYKENVTPKEKPLVAVKKDLIKKSI